MIGTPNSRSSAGDLDDIYSSAKRRGVSRSTSGSGSASGSRSISNSNKVSLPPMSLGSLMNDEKDNKAIVRMLSLGTQGSHANLRPVPLATYSYRSPSLSPDQDSSDHGVQSGKGSTSTLKVHESRKRGREEDQEDIQYLGRTPSTWKKWEASGGVRSENGSPYCYAYDDNGQRYKPELSFVFMIRLVIAASPRKRLSLASIYQAIEERWPYFQNHDVTTWKNSVRHCLSFNAGFVNIDRSTTGQGQERIESSGGGGGRGGYWTLVEAVKVPVPTPQTSPLGSYWRPNPTSPDEPQYRSKRARPTRDQALANMKQTRNVIHPKPYPSGEVSPKQPIHPIHSIGSQHSSPLHTSPRQIPLHLQGLGYGYGYGNKSRSSTSSFSNRSSLTQASDLGIEMSRAFLAEEPVLDHVLDVDMVAPGHEAR